VHERPGEQISPGRFVFYVVPLPEPPRLHHVRGQPEPAFDPELQVAAWADGEMGVGYAPGSGGIP